MISALVLIQWYFIQHINNFKCLVLVIYLFTTSLFVTGLATNHTIVPLSCSVTWWAEPQYDWLMPVHVSIFLGPDHLYCLAGCRLAGGSKGIRLASAQRPGCLQRPLSRELHPAPGLELQLLPKELTDWVFKPSWHPEEFTSAITLLTIYRPMPDKDWEDLSVEHVWKRKCKREKQTHEGKKVLIFFPWGP